VGNTFTRLFKTKNMWRGSGSIFYWVPDHVLVLFISIAEAIDDLARMRYYQILCFIRSGEVGPFGTI